MKKLILISMIMIMVLFSKTITIKVDANIRADHSAKSEVIGSIKAGRTIEVLSSFADYVYLDVVSGSDHAGKTGWMWSERVDNGKVIIEGCTLRSSPEKKYDNTQNDTSDDHNFIAKVRKGANVKVIKSNIIWYKIEDGWVSAICIK